VQQRGNRLIFVATVFEHESRDGQQMRDVRDAIALAGLVGVQPHRLGHRGDEPVPHHHGRFDHMHMVAQSAGAGNRTRRSTTAFAISSTSHPHFCDRSVINTRASLGVHPACTETMPAAWATNCRSMARVLPDARVSSAFPAIFVNRTLPSITSL
jgi:hypothetical protein